MPLPGEFSYCPEHSMGLNILIELAKAPSWSCLVLAVCCGAVYFELVLSLAGSVP